MAYGFLSLEWNESPQYKAAAKQLMKTWRNNVTDPLKEVCSIMKWLLQQAKDLQRPKSYLSNLRSVKKTMLPLFLKQLLDGLIKGIDITLKAAVRYYIDHSLCI